MYSISMHSGRRGVVKNEFLPDVVVDDDLTVRISSP